MRRIYVIFLLIINVSLSAFSQLKLAPSIEMHNNRLCIKFILDNQYNDSIWVISSREGNIRGASGFFLKCFNNQNIQLGSSFPLDFSSRTILYIPPKKQIINYYPVDSHIGEYVGAKIEEVAEIELEIYINYKIIKNRKITDRKVEDFTLRIPFPQKTMELIDKSKYFPYLRGIFTNLQTAQKIMELYNYPAGNINKVYQALLEKNGKYQFYSSSGYCYEEVVNCIDRHLSAGRPIIVGVSYQLGFTQYPDQSTDRYIVVTGKGYDEGRKQTYYTYMETCRGVNNDKKACNIRTNRLYYNPAESSLKDDTAGAKSNLIYFVTQAIPNDGYEYGTINPNNL